MTVLDRQPSVDELHAAFNAAYHLRWSKLPERMTDFELAVLSAFQEDDRVLLWRLYEARHEEPTDFTLQEDEACTSR